MASSSKIIPTKPKLQRQVKPETRNWSELPFDVTANILYRIGVDDILEYAQNVCTRWRQICKDPAMWRVIRMQNNCYRLAAPHFRNVSPEFYRKKCKLAVDRSQGQLVDLTILGFCDNELLQYIADRSRQLSRLEIAWFDELTCQNWTEALNKVPSLEELSLCSSEISKDVIENAGRSCPMLKKLTVDIDGRFTPFFGSATADEILIAVGENFSELRHLKLGANRMTNHGMKAILDGCGHLESLDLRWCFNIDVNGVLWKRCIKQLKCLKLPDGTPEGFPNMNLDDDYDDIVLAYANSREGIPISASDDSDEVSGSDSGDSDEVSGSDSGNSDEVSGSDYGDSDEVSGSDQEI